MQKSTFNETVWEFFAYNSLYKKFKCIERSIPSQFYAIAQRAWDDLILLGARFEDLCEIHDDMVEGEDKTQFFIWIIRARNNPRDNLHLFTQTNPLAELRKQYDKPMLREFFRDRFDVKPCKNWKPTDRRKWQKIMNYFIDIDRRESEKNAAQPETKPTQWRSSVPSLFMRKTRAGSRRNARPTRRNAARSTPPEQQNAA